MSGDGEKELLTTADHTDTQMSASYSDYNESRPSFTDSTIKIPIKTNTTPPVSSHGLRPTSRFTSHTREKIEKLLLALAVIILAILFIIPLVSHFLEVFEPRDEHCYEAVAVSPECKELSWSSVENYSMPNSSCVKYSGTACKDFLQIWQSCGGLSNHDSGDMDSTYVNMMQHNAGLESYLDDIIDDLSSASKTCSAVAVPFLCQYVFPLCNHADTGSTTLLPSREECLYVSQIACPNEWETAKALLPKGLLPVCNELSNQTHPNTTSLLPIEAQKDTAFNCSEQFYMSNNTGCLPSCYKFKQSSDVVTLLTTINEIAIAWFGFLMSIVVLIISVIRRKTIFTVPSVFLVYMTISYMVIVLFAVITFFDQGGLYCSSRDLNYTMNNPTPFCTMAGMAFHYFLISATLWWFIHVSFVFFMLVFPVKANQMKKYYNLIHVILVCTGVLLPSIPVIYTLTKSEYTLGQFPPLLCIPKSGKLWYYSSILVLNVLVGIGVCMFPPMFWVIHKHKDRRNRGLMASAAERKIVFVLCYYAIFGISSLIYFGLTTWEQDKFMSYLLKYFACEAFGNNNCSHCYRHYSQPLVKNITFIIMSMVPVANLVFVVNWKKVGSTFDRCKVKLKMRNHEELKNEKDQLF